MSESDIMDYYLIDSAIDEKCLEENINFILIRSIEFEFSQFAEVLCRLFKYEPEHQFITFLTDNKGVYTLDFRNTKTDPIIYLQKHSYLKRSVKSIGKSLSNTKMDGNNNYMCRTLSY